MRVSERLGTDVLAESAAAVQHALARIEVDDWAGPTPCDEWNVRDLVAHLVRGHRGYALLLAGADGPSLVRSPDWSRDVLGADPCGAFARAAAELRARFASADDNDLVAHPSGAMPVSTLFVLRVLDDIVHAWDLAAAVGATVEVPDDLVAFVMDRGALWQTPAVAQYFAPVAPAGAGANDQWAELLRLTGRGVTHYADPARRD